MHKLLYTLGSHYSMLFKKRATTWLTAPYRAKAHIQLYEPSLVQKSLKGTLILTAPLLKQNTREMSVKFSPNQHPSLIFLRE